MSFTGLSIEKYKGLKANYHTHTPRCNHATGSEREYVEEAIKNGFKVLGFSDHGPHIYDEDFVSRVRMKPDELEGYCRVVTDLASEYRDDIKILTGLEMEYYPPRFDDDMMFIEQFPLDYMILGQHWYYDEPYTPYTGNITDDPGMLKGYINVVIEGIETGLFTYVAHPDLIHYVGDMSVYDSEMPRLAQALAAHGMPCEVNVNGYREKIQYPSTRFMKMAADAGCEFIIGVDAHNPWELSDIENYNACRQMALNAGGMLINL